jgi:NADH dehydrogenase/NADH:ubiquinone oxidoreductase subunit G
MAAIVYSKQSDSSGDRAVAIVNGIKADMVTKAQLEERLKNVGDWYQALTKEVRDDKNANDHAFAEMVQHFDHQTKQLAILESRQFSLEKKQAVAQALSGGGASGPVSRHIKVTFDKDSPMPVEVLHNGPPATTPPPTKGKGRGALLKRSGVAQ